MPQLVFCYLQTDTESRPSLSKCHSLRSCAMRNLVDFCHMWGETPRIPVDCSLRDESRTAYLHCLFKHTDMRHLLPSMSTIMRSEIAEEVLLPSLIPDLAVPNASLRSMVVSACMAELWHCWDSFSLSFPLCLLTVPYTKPGMISRHPHTYIHSSASHGCSYTFIAKYGWR